MNRVTERVDSPGLRAFGLAAAVIAVGAAAASAQTSPHYGTLDATDKAELTQWASHYWARVDAGTIVPPNTFSFTKAAMNDPLFLPVRGARRTLEVIGAIEAQACDGLTELDPGLGDVAISDAFREAMTLWKFRTDPVGNHAGTQAHLNLINAAPSTSNVAWGMEGTHLVSTNLPWEPLTGGNAAAAMAQDVSTTTLDIIGKLALTAPAIAKASKGVTQAQAMITGQKSQADRFEEGIVQYLADQGSNASAWRVDAMFGVFGSLPMLGVTFDDAFVLLDATEGNLDGPFDLDSPLDATALLSQHAAYATGTTVGYVNANGCPIVAAPRWRRNPPPGGPFTPRPAAPNMPTPPIIVPGVPAGFPTLPLNPALPGWWTDWACLTTPGPGPWAATCTCYAYGRYDDPAGGSHWVRRRCVGNFPCGAGPATIPPGRYTPLPEQDGELREPPFPTPGPSVSPGAAWTCRLEYYY